MKLTCLGWAAAFLSVVTFYSQPAEGRELSIEDRVDARAAVEQVYWRHRIWPPENPQPKPAFVAAMPEATIRAKVADELARDAAIEQRWQRSIGRDQIQAEMNRIAVASKDPALLAELFDALQDDPELIAETLVRPLLTDRLLRSLYARDPVIHASLRRLAARALVEATSIDDLRGARVVRSETTVELEAWDRSRPDSAARERRAGALGALEESDEAFFVESVVPIDTDHIHVISVSWPKRPFDAWWREQRARYVGSAPVETAGAAYILPAITAGGCVNDSWSSLSTFVAAQRSEHTAVWTGSEMIVWGGNDPESHLRNDGGRYTPATDSWRPMDVSGAPGARHLHTAIWTGSEMVVWGGRGSGAGNGARYNPSTDTWASVSAVNAPTGRLSHTAVWTGSEMIVWGGNDCYIDCGNYFNSGGRYSPLTDSWVATSTTGAPAGRKYHAAVWTGSRMIVWGGGGPATTPGTGGVYDPVGDAWTATSTSNAPLGYSGMAAVWTGSVMVVWGGYSSVDGQHTATGGRYDPVTNVWTPTSTNGAPDARINPSMVWTGSQVIVWGGSTRNLVPFNSGGRYAPSTDSWIPTSTIGAPDARTNHAAVWTGSEMVVWGGNGLQQGSKVFTGGRYNPVSDSWMPTATNAPAPTPRSSAVAVWTGVEMVVWGGSPVTTTGGRYNAALDSWTPTQTLDAPSARSKATGVWTGERVLIWGGNVGISSGPTNTGGGYRPADDSWLTLSTTSAPEARAEHTAIWDGSEMIVWGGVRISTYLNSGGRFVPATNSWTSTGTAAAPTARRWHTAVWDGRQMIVWGGVNGPVTTCTGGRYDPVTNGWSSMAGIGAPCTTHTAIWSGSEMLIWGSPAPGGPVGVGARYRPETNGWIPISATGAPTSSTGHSAVWTGSAMAIWGGSAGSALFTDSGALYSPATNSWTPMTRFGPVPSLRTDHSAVWTGSEMLVWGGRLAPGTGARYCACAGGTVQLWYRDADGDGFGNASDTVYSCGVLAGYVTSGGDCNDAAAAVNPTAPDAVCNGVDDDCDGTADDGYVSQPMSCGMFACARTGALVCVSGQIHDTCVPGTPTVETCNGADDDCDGTVDNVAAPVAVAMLSGTKIAGGSQWSWTALPNATEYDVTRGDLGSLTSSGGDFALATQTCIGSHVAAPVTDADTPPTDSGFWYVVRGVNCAGIGSYDDGSASISESRDPGILASGLGCP